MYLNRTESPVERVLLMHMPSCFRDQHGSSGETIENWFSIQS